MGLNLCASGYKETLKIGYGGFMYVRTQIAKAYSEKHGKLYAELAKNWRDMDMDEFDAKWSDGCDDDLDLLLWHSDCDGRLRPQECAKIYNALAKLNVELEGDYKEFYDELKNVLDHCRKRRVILFFY